MTLTGQVIELGVGQLRDHMLSVGEGHDVVVVAVPPPDRNLDVIQPEAPVAREDDDVGERCRHLLAAAVEQVVEEHRLDLGAGQQAPVAFR